MRELEKRIGYEFGNVSLLEEALTSPSCRMERPDAVDNQRLEFLGDAVFGLLSADAVFAAYPDEQEGSLTVRRTHLVSTAALVAAANRIGIGEFLKRNAGAGPLPKNAKMLADAMEAVMGAVWLDGGLECAKAVFARLELPIGEKLNVWSDNPKGHLQVLSQSMKPSRKPVYTVDSVEGPAHSPIVTVTVTVAGLGAATVTARTQRQAEIEAASALLEKVSFPTPSQTSPSVEFTGKTPACR